jgi:hypothetical protein
MRTGVSAKTAKAAVKVIAAASKKTVRNLFMNFFSPFFSRHGAGNKLEASEFKKKTARKAASLLQDSNPPFQKREAYLFPDIPCGPAPLVKTGRSSGSEVTEKVP